jgi:hypothetical protein
MQGRRAGAVALGCGTDQADARNQTMTTHELAKKLLEMPDVPVCLG